MNIAAGLIPRTMLAAKPKAEGDRGESPERSGAESQTASVPPKPPAPTDTTSALKKGQRVLHADGRSGKVHYFDPERGRARLTMDDGSKLMSVRRSDLQPLGEGAHAS